MLVLQTLHSLTDCELAMVLYTQLSGEAKSLLEALEVADLQRDDSLAMIWSLLDSAHHKTQHERSEDAYAAWEKAHRLPGQTTQQWMTYLKKTRVELLVVDPGKTISDQEMASKMLRGMGLSAKEKAQCLFNCGNIMDPTRMEHVLLVTYPRIGDLERRHGAVPPKAHDFHKSKHADSDRRKFSSQHKHHRVHEVHEATNEEQSEGEPPQQHPEEEVEASEREPDEEENDEEPSELQEEEGDTTDDGSGTDVQEAFLAGWRAKQKTAHQRKARGFTPARRSAPSGDGGKDNRNRLDARKASSRCADCKQLGHWKGDPQCPLVKSGKVKPFTAPKNKGAPTGGGGSGSGGSSAKQPHKSYPTITGSAWSTVRSTWSLGGASSPQRGRPRCAA